MYKVTLFYFCFFTSSMFSPFCYSADISLLADGSFTGEIELIGENQLGGLDGEIVSKALKAKNITFDLEWRPWARAYKEALDNKNKKTFIIPLTRIVERENLFVWCSKIYDAHTVFISMKGAAKVNTFKEAQNLRIGVIAGSSYLAILKRPENGLLEDNIETVAFDSRNFSKLIGKRIDAWFTLDIVGITTIKNSIDGKILTEKSFQIGKAIAKQEKYIGTTIDTPKELINKVHDAIESFKKTSEYTKIISRIPN
nr:hypothetical protein GTC16762_12060 [Pigmentibacter ruber]